MTSPDNTTAPAAPAPPPTAPAPPPTAPRSSPTALDNLVATMGMAQLLVVGGSLLLVLIDIVLGMLVDEYFIGPVPWAATTIVLLAFVVNRQRLGTLPLPYETILLLSAMVVALVGLRDIIYELLDVLRASSTWDATELLGLVLYIAGVVAVSIGGWQLFRGRR